MNSDADIAYMAHLFVFWSFVSSLGLLGLMKLMGWGK